MTSWIIIFGGLFLIVLLIIGLVVSSNSERSLVEQRLNQYLEEDKSSVDRDVKNTVITDWVTKRVERTSLGDRISRDLARADLKFKVAEYFALIGISILLGALLAWFLGNRYMLSALMGPRLALLPQPFT